MKYKDIQRLIKPIKVIQLAEDNFQNFCKNAVGFFIQKDANFRHYISPGYDVANSKLLNEKPEWRYKARLKLENLEKGEDYLIVDFKGGPWSTIAGDVGPPIPLFPPTHLLFGFNSDKAMYLAHEQENGNKKGLWEDLYIKFD